ncbi:homoserine kinase [Corynebacterium pseudotuberculosis]|uniref:Homoserine kinase n=1 Tax=Corynebacterium pseudotuberculosis (strain C231) TaxID=681645 RepID=D9Q9T9_CORP2|nr:homoserine kinase [Corynebacterium pseudotuberculosis]ADK28628.1 homoserine kinase [Corynebacterium pseudotuberculosis FRC41]ADL10315.1 homoserine kinase [Corynebacterium pseudotuberculosis C231]ADL20720.1 homoserine kinase [Corynebacterium pseudotuberculosis 1002]ADO26107.1 homoserine kinase [Corynebacterium pseudotuberculosis I19]AEK92163.1 Homoserine kinase [Corynebacterium pseudotuberculosis PAT10]
MSIELEVGKKVSVTVPASSANLGPGFDTLGLAVSLYDTVEVEVVAAGLSVEVFGEGQGNLPLDGSHLVVKALRAGLKAADVQAPGLKVVCHNSIPQSRGLGSSAAAAVAGVCAANGLAGFPLSNEQLVQLSSAFEGHPDNAAASVLGQAVVSWTEIPVDGRTEPQYRAVTIPVAESIMATALVPNFHASTEAVRRVLPTDVTHVDARFNVSRCAVMTVALQHHPELLWEGTRDRLHQPYRADVLPVTAEWVNRLRNRGYAAYLSGAGPTVMVLSTKPVDESVLNDAREAGLRVLSLKVAQPVSVTVS